MLCLVRSAAGLISGATHVQDDVEGSPAAKTPQHASGVNGDTPNQQLILQVASKTCRSISHQLAHQPCSSSPQQLQPSCIPLGPYRYRPLQSVASWPQPRLLLCIFFRWTRRHRWTSQGSCSNCADWDVVA